MPILLSLRLPENLEQRLDNEAAMQGCNRSRVARLAIEDYLDRMDRERMLEVMAREMKAAYGKPGFRQHALETAEDALDDGLPDEVHTPDEPWWV